MLMVAGKEGYVQPGELIQLISKEQNYVLFDFLTGTMRRNISCIVPHSHSKSLTGVVKVDQGPDSMRWMVRTVSPEPSARPSCGQWEACRIARVHQARIEGSRIGVVS